MKAPVFRRAAPALRALLGALVVVTLAACGDAARASIDRGDRLLARGEFESAIAEYKLALRQEGETPETLQRLAHAYARAGDVDESLRYYETLLARDSSHRWQMASDLAALARRAGERGARENMARALQPLLRHGVGLVPADLQLAMARHYWQDGDYAPALPLYFTVLADTLEVDPEVHYETGRALEELGGCERALGHYERYLSASEGEGPQRASARWHYGNCLFETAARERAAGRPRAALEKLDGMVELGVPQTRVERAHFLRGELLLALGDTERALSAYERVLELNPARSGPLVQQAEQRIREIRFGY